uniref:Phospholipid/glycerol acyltransferase domain-containing protein n=1 Tax=Acrobeloides nanus TaxID=290746 RepID=A0A914D1K8_9BILA
MICRFCGYLLFKVFRRVMKRLLVCPEQLTAVKEAELSGIPIVYLPLHRSHLDYLLITWTVWHFGIRLPHIASGNNLNLSGFGWLLRGTGAFFIRRRLSPDDEASQDELLYRTVLNQYMVELLKAGLSIEFFLEGTRSRFGKTLLPKNGLISNVVDAVESGVIPDVWLVPVSFSYDNVIEGMFYDELLGIRKEKESVMGVIKGIYKSFGEQGRCGTVMMNFGTPVRLTAYKRSLEERIAMDQFYLKYAPNPNSYRELLPWHNVRTPNRTLIRAIGFHLVSDAQENRPISVSSIAALLICSKYNELGKNSAKLWEFSEEIRLLCEEIKNLGFEVIGGTNEIEMEDKKFAQLLVKEAIYYLGDSETFGSIATGNAIIGTHIGNESYLNFSTERHALMDLCYKKNSAIVPYLLHSAISIVILATAKIVDGKIIVEDLIDNTLHITDLLQCEVIFCKPCENLESLISKLANELLRNTIEGNTSVENVGNLMLAFNLTFYANILKPFLLTLLIVTNYFLRFPNSTPQLRDIDFIRKFLEERIQSASYLDAEALNSDSIYNSIKLLRQKGVISMNGLELNDEDQAQQIVHIIGDKFKIQSAFVI